MKLLTMFLCQSLQSLHSVVHQQEVGFLTLCELPHYFGNHKITDSRLIQLRYITVSVVFFRFDGEKEGAIRHNHLSAINRQFGDFTFRRPQNRLFRFYKRNNVSKFHCFPF